MNAGCFSTSEHVKSTSLLSVELASRFWVTREKVQSTILCTGEALPLRDDCARFLIQRRAST